MLFNHEINLSSIRNDLDKIIGTLDQQGKLLNDELSISNFLNSFYIETPELKAWVPTLTGFTTTCTITKVNTSLPQCCIAKELPEDESGHDNTPIPKSSKQNPFTQTVM